MKNILLTAFLFLGLSASAQKYYPKLNNLFLENVDENSLFGEELNYFREGLRAATNKLFYGNLQTSSGTNAAFYSMKIIPRFIPEYEILESGVFLKFNATSKEEHPSFPLIANEFFDEIENVKTGFGDITIGNDGILLKFNNNIIVALDTQKRKVIENSFAEFTVNKIKYKIQQSSLLVIELQGSFNTDVKIKKNKYSKDQISVLTITVEKEAFLISFIDLISNKEISFLNQKIISAKK